MRVVANLATYPRRRDGVIETARRIAPQVDRLNLVLNEYDEAISELSSLGNIEQIIPAEDTKDTGKFLPAVGADDIVFLIDDDLIYPEDYVAMSLQRIEKYQKTSIVFGYHGSSYILPRFSLNSRHFKRWWTYDPARIAEYRRVIPFYRKRDKAFLVDQIGTGTGILRGNLMPSFEYMASSQSFVDVRLAKWCFEQGIPQVALPKADYWIQDHSYEETIYGDFTRHNPANVAEEIRGFAYKRPMVGRVYTPE